MCLPWARAVLLVVVMGWLFAAAEETADWEDEDLPAGEDDESLYDADSKGADHTAFAIAFEKAGKIDSAALAFSAAVRHNKNANTLVNLGVFMMRQRKFTGRGEALDSMWQAKKRYRTAESAPLINENWSALMQTMRALKVPVPERYKDRVGIDDLPSFTDDSIDWQDWFDRDESADELLAHAIEKDRHGDIRTAGRAFLAAVHTRPDALTLVNWGVFMLHRRKFSEALKALYAARVTYRSTAPPDKLKHIDQNWCVVLSAATSLSVCVCWLVMCLRPPRPSRLCLSFCP